MNRFPYLASWRLSGGFLGTYCRLGSPKEAAQDAPRKPLKKPSGSLWEARSKEIGHEKKYFLERIWLFKDNMKLKNSFSEKGKDIAVKYKFT